MRVRAALRRSVSGVAWRHAASCSSKWLERYASVLDAGFLHSDFPADALLACRFDLVEASSLCGFAARGGLLCDLGELVFEGTSGGVGPFARPVRLAAAEDEAEAFGRGVVEAGDPDPGVLLGLCKFLRGGDVLGTVLFLEGEEPHCLPVCGDAEVDGVLRRR
ncbi:hypothetical protein ABZ702_26550 [Streptomyces cyaneofuscatus]|uniref:hypothetical protein n=1 Tax=Streptomyces cyaneofuscatus TaxID=66883 RepID=UPI0033C3855D